MAQVGVYMCEKGHLYYGDDPPEHCSICGSMNFGALPGVTVDTEDGNDISSKPGYYNT